MSCSVIGLGIGAAIDHSNPDTKSVENREIDKMGRGTSVTVHLLDESKLDGSFDGLVGILEARYAESYSSIRARYNDLISLPAIGDVIEINCRWRKKTSYEFRGFDYEYRRRRGRVSLKKKEFPGVQYIYLSAKPADEDEFEKFYLNDLREVADKHGNVVKGGQLRELAEKGRIPLRSAVSLKTSTGKKLITVDRIGLLEGPRVNNAKYLGLLAGLVVDVILVVGLSQWKDSGPLNFGD
jgi:hypothetical protein